MTEPNHIRITRGRDYDGGWHVIVTVNGETVGSFPADSEAESRAIFEDIKLICQVTGGTVVGESPNNLN